MDLTFRFLCFALGVYQLILLARIILSWLPALPEGLRPIIEFVYAVTEPLLRFFRPLIPPLRIGMLALDLSVILVFILLGFVQQIACSAAL